MSEPFAVNDLVVYGKAGQLGWGQGGVYRVTSGPHETDLGPPCYGLDWVSGRRTHPSHGIYVFASELAPQPVAKS